MKIKIELMNHTDSDGLVSLKIFIDYGFGATFTAMPSRDNFVHRITQLVNYYVHPRFGNSD